MLPKSQLSPELKKKNELLKKFQNLSEIKPNKRKLTRSVTPVVKKEKVELNIMKPKQFKNLIMRLELGNKKNFLNHNQFLNKKNQIVHKDFLKNNKKQTFRNEFKTPKIAEKGSLMAGFFISPNKANPENFYKHRPRFAIFDEKNHNFCEKKPVFNRKKPEFSDRVRKDCLSFKRNPIFFELLERSLSISPMSYSERPKSQKGNHSY